MTTLHVFCENLNNSFSQPQVQSKLHFWTLQWNW